MNLVEPMLDEEYWRKAWLAIAGELDGQAAFDALVLLDAREAPASERLALASAWTDLGQRMQNADCFARALAQASEAGKDGEFAAPALIAQGVIAEINRDWSKAEQCYRQASRLKPGDPIVLNNLAFVLAQTPERCPEALDLIQQALVRAPNHPDLLDTYGIVMLGLDRLAEAQTALSQALAARPDDVNISLNLIEVLLKQDQFDRAEDEIEQLRQRVRNLPRLLPTHQTRLEMLRQKLEASQTVAGT
jgi:Flp pilus assembly protein TadD